MIRGVTVVLWAQDLTRAVGFWGSAFGLPLTYQDSSWAALAAPGMTIGLHAGHDGSTVTSGLSLEVDDLDASVAAVAGAGGTVVEPPSRRPGEPLILASVRDPEGNVFQLTRHD